MIGLTLPVGGIREPSLEHLSAEEIYETLLSRKVSNKYKLRKSWRDLGKASSSPRDDNAGPAASRQRAENDAYWKNALRQAEVMARTSSQGKLPAGWEREVARIGNTQLDWRSYLWRFAARTPDDYNGFDRRFVWQVIYLDALDSESIEVFIAVDTSGSVNHEMIGQFLGEVRGIVSTYSRMQATLWYADTRLYGPYDLTEEKSLPKLRGGGGTSFIPFFAELEQQSPILPGRRLAIYLTDGFGDFPNTLPELSVLWVIPPGGLPNEKFPFGEVARLI